MFMYLISDKRKNVSVFYPSSSTNLLRVYVDLDEILSSINGTTYIYQFNRPYEIFKKNDHYFSNNPIVGRIIGVFKKSYYGFEYSQL